MRHMETGKDVRRAEREKNKAEKNNKENEDFRLDESNHILADYIYMLNKR